MVSLEGPDEDGVFIIHLGNTENRIDFKFIDTFREFLPTILNHRGPKAVVITAEGKFFSNGLSIETLSENPHKLLLTYHSFLRELLTFPVPLVAAINGHAFAGGAMLSFACDYRIMNSQKGFICVNEVDIGLPLTPGFWGIVRSKVNRSDWTEMVLFAKRFSGEMALKSGMIHATSPPDELLKAAIKLAAKIAPRGAKELVFGSLKKQMYSEEISLLGEGLGYAEETARQFVNMSKL